jgi:rubrerythrin
MPIRRDQTFPERGLPAYLRSNEYERLQTVFRRALGIALASSLVGACESEQVGREPGGETAEGDQHAADSGKPSADASRPDAAKPDVTKPDAAKPDVTKPDVTKPDAGSNISDDNDAGSTNVAGASGAPSAAGAGAAGSGGQGFAGQSAGTGGMVASNASEAVCNQTQWQMLVDLTPAEEFDYATARVAYQIDTPTLERASIGTACESSTGMMCQTDLEKALDREGLTHSRACGMIGQCTYFVVTTQGDVVKRYATREELLEFLGEIDSPQDAFLLLDFDGYTVQCPGGASFLDDPAENMRTSTATETTDGYEVSLLKLVSDCPFQYARVKLSVTRSGVVTELERELLMPGNACAGRRPEGWTPRGAERCISALGEHFARMAELEAASVSAFDALANELAHHGAPSALIAAARSARSDEIRHKQRTAELAGKLGAYSAPVEVPERALRGLEEIALDNAVEGCVNETFAAAVGCYQAQTASDPQIAQLMLEIAADETRHAALSLQIDAWITPQLSDEAKARVQAARVAAAAKLAAELTEPEQSLKQLAGLPELAQARSLHASLQRELWS